MQYVAMSSSVENKPEILKRIALEKIEESHEALIKLSRFINSNPETAYRETKAVSALTSFFGERGFRITAPLCGIETAFSADYCRKEKVEIPDSGKTDLAFIAEYDALKGIGHGCAHNLIAASAAAAAIGTAAALEAAGPDFYKPDGSLPSFRVIGTPAEEIIERNAGKIVLLEAGAFDDVGTCLMFHPWTESGVALKDLGASACRVVFHGRAAHAAADPWNGINALDAGIIFYNSVSMLRQQLPPGLKMHCILPEAGRAVNVIPDRCVAEVMFRSTEIEELDGMAEKLEHCAEGAAATAGCTTELQLLSSMKPVLFNRKLFNLLERNMRSKGETLQEIPVWKASSDFGDVSRICPSISLLYNTHAGVKSWHSKEVARKAAENYAETAMLRAAGYLAMTAIDLFF